MRILIVGGGLGGLTLAAFLEDSSIEYDIVEKSPDWEKQGYALGLWSNGRNILKKLGLADLFDAKGTRIHTYSICDGAGRVLRTYNLSDFYEDYGIAMTLVDRHELHSWLLNKVDQKRILMGTSVDSITPAEARVTVRLSNGQAKDYDVVVGADGVHSQVRKLIFKDDIEAYDDWRVWYGWIDNHFKHQATIIEYLEAGAVIIVFDTGQKTLVNFIAPVSHALQDTPQYRVDRLRSLFKSETILVPDAFQSLQDEDFTPTDLARVRLMRWSKGSVVLLGDAAHACEPFAGLGGSMALEDAYVLAGELMKAGNAYPLREALKNYESKRRQRVATVLKLTNRMRAWALTRSKFLRKCLNLFVSFVPERFFVKDYQDLLTREI